MTLDLKTKRIIDLEVGDVLYYPTTEESIGVVVPFQHQAGKMSLASSMNMRHVCSFLVSIGSRFGSISTLETLR